MRRALAGVAVALFAAVGVTYVYKHRHHPSVNPVPVRRVRVSWPADRPLRVLFIGDSLTVGYYATQRTRAFSALVTDALRARGSVRQTIIARGGVKSSYFTARSLPSADVIVLELGTNDFSNDLTPRARFDRDYRRLVANVRATSPRAQLLCVSLWRSSQYGFGGENLLTYNKIVAKECRGGTFVWISQHYDDSGSRGPDGRVTWIGTGDHFHPNDTGHARIAADIESTLSLR